MDGFNISKNQTIIKISNFILKFLDMNKFIINAFSKNVFISTSFHVFSTESMQDEIIYRLEYFNTCFKIFGYISIF
jgi:hypothetical protein